MKLRTIPIILTLLLITTGCNYSRQLQKFCNETRAAQSEYTCRVVKDTKGKDRTPEKISTLVDRIEDGERRRIRITKQDAEDFVTEFWCAPNAAERYAVTGWNPDWIADGTLDDITCPEPEPAATGQERILQLIAGVFPDHTVNATKIAKCESTFDPKAIGGIGERGLMQIHPNHFRGVWSNVLPNAGFTWDDMFDPQKNLEAARILFDLNGQKWGRRTPSSPLIWSCAPIVGVP